MFPELGPFFESLVDLNDPNQLTASQPLARFTEICDGLSPKVAQTPFDTWIWDYGKHPKPGHLTHEAKTISEGHTYKEEIWKCYNSDRAANPNTSTIVDKLD